MTEHLIYDPPKSVAFGHAPRRKDPNASWDMLQSFLERHTTVGLRPDFFVQAVGALGYGGENMIFPTKQTLEDVLGRPAYSEEEHNLYRWKICKADLPSVFQIFLSAHKSHAKKVSSFTLNLAYDFRWLGIEDSTIGGSMLGVIVDDYNGIFLQPTYAFPFAWGDLNARSWLKTLLEESPFRFRDQYFQRGIPKKNGLGYRTMKLKAGWLDAA